MANAFRSSPTANPSLSTTAFVLAQSSLQLQIQAAMARARNSEHFKKLEALTGNSNEDEAFLVLLETELEELKSTKSHSLQLNRIAYLKEIIGRLSDMSETNEARRSEALKNSGTELAELKKKIEKLVDKTSLEWKMRAAIELAFAEGWKFKNGTEDAPFYVEGGKISANLSSTKDSFLIIGDPEMIRDLNDPQGVANEMNHAYVAVRRLMSLSTSDVSKYVGPLFDIVRNPSSIGSYEHEFGKQPWFKSFDLLSK